uniref:RRM domain-containing protein n=1 Tax=Papio anubis TaxID=9555 RepID=A0A8I5NR68_PAPAN
RLGGRPLCLGLPAAGDREGGGRPRAQPGRRCRDCEARGLAQGWESGPGPRRGPERPAGAGAGAAAPRASPPAGSPGNYQRAGAPREASRSTRSTGIREPRGRRRPPRLRASRGSPGCRARGTHAAARGGQPASGPVPAPRTAPSGAAQPTRPSWPGEAAPGLAGKPEPPGPSRAFSDFPLGVLDLLGPSWASSGLLDPPRAFPEASRPFPGPFQAELSARWPVGLWDPGPGPPASTPTACSQQARSTARENPELSGLERILARHELPKEINLTPKPNRMPLWKRKITNNVTDGWKKCHLLTRNTKEPPMSTIVVRWLKKNMQPTEDLKSVICRLSAFGPIQSVTVCGRQSAIVAFKDMTSACNAVSAFQSRTPGTMFQCSWQQRFMSKDKTYSKKCTQKTQPKECKQETEKTANNS